jgi:hypothetical protein
MKKEIVILVLAVAWTIPWKGIALWKAAQAKQKIWFIVLLAVNTLALLEILYIFIFSGKKEIDEPKQVQK